MRKGAHDLRRLGHQCNLLLASALVVSGCSGGTAADTQQPGGSSEPVSAPAFVQQAYATPQSPQSTVQVVFPGAQTGGNLNVVVVGCNGTSSTVSSVSDSKGNVYTRAVGPIGLSGTLSQWIYYAKNITAAAAGGNTVTVVFSQATVYPDIRILEYSGLDPASPVDVTAQASGTSSGATSGAATTTNANDLIFGANMTTGTTSGPGTGFTSRVVTSPDSDIAEDRVVTTPVATAWPRR